MDMMNGPWNDYAAAAVAPDGPWNDYAAKTPGDRAGGGAQALRQHQAPLPQAAASASRRVAEGFEDLRQAPPGRRPAAGFGGILPPTPVDEYGRDIVGGSAADNGASYDAAARVVAAFPPFKQAADFARGFRTAMDVAAGKYGRMEDNPAAFLEAAGGLATGAITAGIPAAARGAVGAIGGRLGGGAKVSRSPGTFTPEEVPQRSSRDIKRSSAYDSSVAQAKEAPISDPPGRPDRPEIADYPHGTPTDAGRITETIDGAPINPAATVVGRAMGGGPESKLSPGEVAALVRQITGQDHQVVPADQMAPRGALGSYLLGDRLTTIDRDLEPRSAARVLAHELGHAIEHERWPDGRTVSDSIIGTMMRRPKIEDELRFVYNDLNNPYLAAERNRLGDPGWLPEPYDMRGWRQPMPQSGPYYEHYGPEDRGYQLHDVHSELIVEGLRAYMTDPNYFKTVAPGAAAAIRNAINRHPRLSEIIQFNMAPLAVAGGSGAAAAALSAGDEAQAGPAAQAFRRQQAARSPADAREHETELLRRFGYSDDDIAAMTPERRAAQAAHALESGISTVRGDGGGTADEPPNPLTQDAPDVSGKLRSEVEGLIREVHGEAHPDDVALAGLLMHRHGLDAHDAFEHATLVNALRAGDISPGQMASVIGKDRTEALRILG